MNNPGPPPSTDSAPAGTRQSRRQRDRRHRIAVAAVCLLLASIAAALVVGFGARVLTIPTPIRRALQAAEDENARCGPDMLHSLDTWALSRLDRGPVPAPKKELWERTFPDRAALQRALRDRLIGWPEFLLAGRDALPRDPAAALRRIATDTWRGLDALSDAAHGLPLDRVELGNGSVDVNTATIGDYTSTTNIGLHLAAVVAAHDLGLLTDYEALDRLRRTLATLSVLETDDGHYFNYYDTTSLERTSQFVSSIDSAWLVAGLMVVRMAFPELYAHCTALIEQMDFAQFYDRGAGLLSHGFFIEPRAPSRYHYGVLYTEARLAALIAIGKGDAPESLWFEMIRTFPPGCRWQTMTPLGIRTQTVLGHEVTAGYYEWLGTRYVPSWGGSMFEALMPTLVVDELTFAPASLGANDRAHAVVQHRYAVRELHLPVWGFSPSAQPGTELYGEFGVPVLGSRGYPPGPVTPHASALALVVRPGAAIANLRRLASRYDVYGDFGFYDAVDPQTGAVAYTYLTLDQSMILLAIANHLTDGAIQKRFAADPIAARVLPLLAAERFFD